MDINIFNNRVIAHFVFWQMCQAIFKLIRKEVEDALIFACRQKRHDIKTQSGRLMIEMLGVLAIVGVLSIGGIAGYSKAMGRYRVNETINQISHIVQNTRDLFKNQPNFYGALSYENGGNAYMSNAESPNRVLDSKAKIFPTSIVRNEYKNLFGGDITYYADGRFADDDGKSFILAIHNIPQEACIELATRDWQSGLGLVAMKIQGSGTGYGIQGAYSGNCTTRYKQGNSITCSVDMPVSIEYAVISCDNEKDNTITWKFY